MNRKFKVIQVHPYWCQQKSRADCCHNVYNNVDIISETYEAKHQENRKFIYVKLSTTPLRFDDSNLRNASEYLEIIYIATN